MRFQASKRVKRALTYPHSLPRISRKVRLAIKRSSIQIAGIAAFGSLLAAAPSFGQHVGGNFALHFLSSGGQSPTYTFQGFDAASLTLTSPANYSISLASSQLGQPGVLWSNPANWTQFALIDDGINYSENYPADFNAVLNGSSSTLDVLKGIGPTFETNITTSVFFTFGGNSTGNPFPFTSNAVSVGFDVVLQPSSNVVLDQYATLHSLTVDGGAVLVSSNSTGLTVAGPLENMGQFQIAGLVTLQSASQNDGVMMLSGGILNGSSAFANNGTFQFSAGSLNLTAMTNANIFQWSGGSITGSVSNSSANFSITGGQEFLTGTLTNTGTISQGGGSNIVFYNGGTLNNQPGGVYNIQDDSGISLGAGGAAINNAGTFEKTGGTGISTVSAPLNNTATVRTTSGTLAFNGGGLLNGGTFTFANSGAANLSGGAFTVQGTNSASGNGSLVISGGATVTVPNGGSGTFANFTGGANLYISNGNVYGDTGGTLTFNLGGGSSVFVSGGNLGGAGSTINAGNFQWSGGTVAGNLSNTSSSFSINGGQEFLTGTLTNTGTIVQGGGSNIVFYNGGTLNNQSGGVYNIQDDSGISVGGGGGAINNAGTFEKTGGAGFSYLNPLVTNSGNLRIQFGTLAPQSGVTNSGAIQLLGGNFDSIGSLVTNSASGSISGSGSFSSGGLTSSGTFSLSNSPSSVHGTVTTLDSGNGLSAITISNNTTTFFGAVTVGNNTTFTANHATVQFQAGLIDNGNYVSDPSTSTLSSLMIGSTGTIHASSGDLYQITGDFINNSTQSSTWNTNLASLQFTGGGGAHQMSVTGPASSFATSYRWGNLVVDASDQLTLSGSAASAIMTSNAGTISQPTGVSSLGILGGAGNLSAGAASGSSAMIYLASVSQNAMTINNTGEIQLQSNSIATNAVNNLAVNGNGVLDLTNNHMFINYGNGFDPIASIAVWIASGYAGGTWHGTGIISTAAQSNSGSYGIGYADSADPGNPAGLASGQIEIMYTLLGDANLDGAVNGSDFAILATNFNKAVTGWDQGDFNYDGAANGSDFALLASNFNKGASQSATAALDTFAQTNGLMADVPEPAELAIMVIAGLGILRGRRRSSKLADCKT